MIGLTSGLEKEGPSHGGYNITLIGRIVFVAPPVIE
jgi:hypothetical protein